MAIACGILSGAYFSGSFVVKVWKQHKFEKEIKLKFKEKLKNKDDIDSFILNRDSSNEPDNKK